MRSWDAELVIRRAEDILKSYGVAGTLLMDCSELGRYFIFTLKLPNNRNVVVEIPASNRSNAQSHELADDIADKFLDAITNPAGVTS